MSEWTVVSVIVVLSGFVISLVKPLLSLNNALTRLTDAVSVLERELEGIAGKNSEAHARLWDKEAEQDRVLQAHEVRLTKLEKK